MKITTTFKTGLLQALPLFSGCLLIPPERSPEVIMTGLYRLSLLILAIGGFQVLSNGIYQELSMRQNANKTSSISISPLQRISWLLIQLLAVLSMFAGLGLLRNVLPLNVFLLVPMLYFLHGVVLRLQRSNYYCLTMIVDLMNATLVGLLSFGMVILPQYFTAPASVTLMACFSLAIAATTVSGSSLGRWGKFEQLSASVPTSQETHRLNQATDARSFLSTRRQRRMIAMLLFGGPLMIGFMVVASWLPIQYALALLTLPFIAKLVSQLKLQFTKLPTLPRHFFEDATATALLFAAILTIARIL